MLEQAAEEDLTLNDMQDHWRAGRDGRDVLHSGNLVKNETKLFRLFSVPAFLHQLFYTSVRSKSTKLHAEPTVSCLRCLRCASTEPRRSLLCCGSAGLWVAEPGNNSAV